jgi:hypothetical protein
LRGAGLAAALLVLGLVLAGTAAAKSFSLPQTSVVATIQPDGSLKVQEYITFAFDGPFSGAYRDIPLRQGELLRDAYVEESGQRYSPGASAELGSQGTPGTYGTASLADRFRIVWHFSAVSRARTFVVGYTLVGVTVAYDDVVDVNLKVWGDQWDQSLGQLTAVMILPAPASGPSYRVWGHPVSVRGDVERQPQQADLRAVHVPPHQFVELRVVFPRSLLQSTGGTQVRHEAALPGSSARSARTLRISSETRNGFATPSSIYRAHSSSCSRPRSCRALRSLQPRTGSSAVSVERATTVSTSRTRRPSSTRRSCRRSSARARRWARSSSPPRSSISYVAGGTRPRR